MATNTYVALDKVTVGTATSTITFNSIPQGYTDLVLVSNFTVNPNNSNAIMRFNNDSTNLYSQTALVGTGSSPTTERESNTNRIFLNNAIANSDTNSTVLISNIMNYSNTTTNKTSIYRFGLASGTYPGTGAIAGLYRSTSAITRIDLIAFSSDFKAGSTFSLYGIAAQTVPGTAKATGGTITYDNFGYVYHTFTSSGTFTPSVALSCDALVIAGGGAGGSGDSGGGGAGGVVYLTSQNLTSAQTITVGAGGASSGGSFQWPTPYSGNNSSVGALTAAVGGGFGGQIYNSFGPATGGSGGGGQANGGSGAAGTAGQGFAGGNGNGTNRAKGGGGGGAGGAGANATDSAAGNGGIGTNLYSAIAAVTSTGVSGYYAGGGGGSTSNSYTRGTGGLGGGGNAAPSAPTYSPGQNGTANTGGGGGGGTNGGDGWTGGAGGSGLVIIKYYGF